MQLVYGNPLRWQKDAIDKGSALADFMKSTPFWNAWLSTPPPAQDSAEVKEDLIMMSELKAEDPGFLEEIEKDLYGVLARECNRLGIDVSSDELLEISKELDPITFSIKYHYNYPRPYQLAYEHGVPVFPIQATDAGSPAYPSGHTIDSFVIMGLMARIKPELTAELEAFAERVSWGRVESGIHFTFDGEFGKQIAADILSVI